MNSPIKPSQFPFQWEIHAMPQSSIKEREQWRLWSFGIAAAGFEINLLLRSQRYNSINKDPGLPALPTIRKELPGYYVPTFHHPSGITITLSPPVKWGDLALEKALARRRHTPHKKQSQHLSLGNLFRSFHQFLQVFGKNKFECSCICTTKW